MKKTDAIEKDFYRETGEMRYPRPLVPTVFANDNMLSEAGDRIYLQTRKEFDVIYFQFAKFIFVKIRDS